MKRFVLSALCVGLVWATWSQISDAQTFGAKTETKLEEIVKFEVRVLPADPFDPRNEAKSNAAWKVRRGQVVRVELTGTIKDGWNTYPITLRTPEQSPGQLTKWAIQAPKGIVPLLPIFESQPSLAHEAVIGDYLKYTKQFVWSQEVFVSSDSPTGKVDVPIKLDIQFCAGNCIWFAPVIPASIDVSDETPDSVSPDLTARVKAVLEPVKKTEALPPTPAKPDHSASRSEGLIDDTFERYEDKMNQLAERITASAKAVADAGRSDLGSFILAGIFWGFISLITPCVFPMIPITVSFFLKQSEKEHHRPIVMASVYSLTIVVVLTAAAAFLLSIFREMSIHPITNYIIGGLFIFFALSLFGMYEIELPNFMAKFTSSREGQGGIVGTIFMALTFTIISFACVAPFLGGFSGTAADARPLWHNILGGLAFAVTFASPFFFLALFPTLLKKLPKSGSWLNVVKVVMGFLELAAAFKFFRTAELIQTAGVSTLFTFDLSLSLWIGMSVLCALYLIGVFRLPHDSPDEHISVPRLLFSMAFLGLAFYLMPALFKLNSEGETQRPRGAIYSWVDSFLLPDSHSDDESTANLDYAVNKSVEEFKRTGKPKRIFIDFTGVTCVNCNINEKSVFTKPDIAKLLDQYHVVKLYTDTVPPEYYSSDIRAAMARDTERSVKDAKLVNLPFQKRLFGTEQLPLYVILEPQIDESIRILSVYDEGRINNEAAFTAFLRNPEGK
jgi:thiol:disulfide interchange protein